MLWTTLLTPIKATTSEAAAYIAFPAWLAVSEHVPSTIKVNVAPATVQMVAVVEAKLTARPLVEVATSA